MRYLFILLLTISCAKDDKKKADPDSTSRIEELKSAYAAKLAEAESIRDPANGWLSRNDCDGMIWAGKYAASKGVAGVNIEAAEYPEAPGKFGRRPAPYCWNATDGDVGSKTEWSRDMFAAGLLPYVWRSDKREILERHLAYGKANNWIMGSPVDDGRVIYTPSLIGLGYQVLYAMGGALDNAALWPSIYPSGLTDYQAHLQVMSIWVAGEAAAKLGDGDAVPKNPDEPEVSKKEPDSNLIQVSNTMFERLKEHAEREPNCPLYQVTYALYSGTLANALDTLLSPDQTCEYLRCSDGQCVVADWLFAASLAIDHAAAYH